VPPYGTQPGQPAVAGQPAPKQRRIGLGVAAAIVAAALIGGASGAGITALISSNQAPASSDSAGSAQNIVVNDADSVNQITAVAAKASPSVVTISVTGSDAGGTGSGIVLSEDGYVLTNTHVVTLDGATGDPTIQVKTNDGHLYTAELVGTDPLSDLAVIKLTDASGLTPLEFADSDKLNVGDTAIAIGAPLGLSGTVTNGIVSALNRSIDVASSAAPTTPDDSTEGDSGQGDTGQGDGSEQSPFDFFFDLPNPDGTQPDTQQQSAASGQVSLPVIQTDAAINPGNSGGALLDSEGKLIGVNVAILSAGGSSTEAGNIGVGFAVPSNLAERIANEIIENGAATHGLLGATVTSAEADGQSEIVGALISEVSSGGAAEQAGLQAGDVVTEFNGVPITDQTDLTAQVRALPGGEKADVTFTRDGESQTVTVTLGTFEG
jgi:putative serine protease PepD